MLEDLSCFAPQTKIVDSDFEYMIIPKNYIKLVGVSFKLEGAKKYYDEEIKRERYKEFRTSTSNCGDNAELINLPLLCALGISIINN